MLNIIFFKILSCGIELGVIVLCLLPLRWIFRRTFPRFFSYLLWCAIPIKVVYNVLVKVVRARIRYSRRIFQEITPWKIEEQFLKRFASLWIIGSVIVLLITIVSYIRFHRRLVGSIHLQENIYITDRITSPFSIGLLCPKIYLPYTLKEKYYPPVVLHEQVHIVRKDIWVKYVALALLTVFWFQPLLWMAYYLFINDMEEACDEAVLRNSEDSFRGEYARALVEVSYQAGRVPGVAIGYGNGEIGARVKNVMRYKRANIKVCIVAAFMCLFVIGSAVLFSLSCPKMVKIGQNQDVKSETLSVQITDDSVRILSDQD